MLKGLTLRWHMWCCVVWCDVYSLLFVKVYEFYWLLVWMSWTQCCHGYSKACLVHTSGSSTHAPCPSCSRLACSAFLGEQIGPRWSAFIVTLLFSLRTSRTSTLLLKPALTAATGDLGTIHYPGFLKKTFSFLNITSNLSSSFKIPDLRIVIFATTDD